MSEGVPYAVLPQWWFVIDLFVGLLALGGVAITAPFVLDLIPVHR